MRTKLALVAAAALVAGGCGGAGGGSATGRESAAPLAPATTDVFVVLDTDLRSKQIRNADAVLKKFPIRDRVLRFVRGAIADAGLSVRALRRSVGPEVDVAVLDTDAGTTVAFTKPRDEEAFNRALDTAKKPLLHTTRHGWTLFSDKQAALDAVTEADEHLDGVAAFENATSKLPDEAIATAYVAGRAVNSTVAGLGVPSSAIGTRGTKWLSAAALSHDDGVELQIHLNGRNAGGAKSYEAQLDDDIPSGALAALSFRDLGGAVRQLGAAGIPFLPSFEESLGVTLEDLADALKGEGVLWVRPGTPIPEVTIVTEPGDDERAVRTVDRLVRKLAPGAVPRATDIDGHKVRRASLGPVDVIYGAIDGKLVVSDSAAAVRDLGDRGGDKLSDDKTFRDAADAAAMPDRTTGWLYLNLKDGVPLVDALAELAGSRIPAEYDDNLRPLRSFVFYGTRAGESQMLELFLQAS